MEKAFFIEGQVRLFGMLFCPDGAVRHSIGFVLIHPFAEEKKSAHRIGVELSRRLCGEGFPVLMFDLRGCGDSEGDFASVRLTDWLTDMECAIDMFRQSTGTTTVGLIGLRFGAYLSGYYAAKRGQVGLCVWIEPVLKPVDYLRKSLRHKLMKELCTEGKVVSNRNDLLQDLEHNRRIDFDGYEIGSPLFRDLMQAQEKEVVLKGMPEIPVELLVSVSMNGRVSKALQEVALLKPGMRMESVCMELFWNKVDEVEGEGLISCIANYLGGKRNE